jgi:sigma-B regulation protein RsbU (phosphoserine phosphatase)
VARVGLRSVIGPRHDGTRLVRELSAALQAPVSVADAEGRLLHGEQADAAVSRYPVTIDGIDLGWVAGPDSARIIAGLLEHLVARETERKALASEVLHLYREVNLIYSFSEKLAAMLDVERVARLTLQEARQLIAASDGAVLLLDEASGVLTTVAGFGGSMPHLTGFTRGVGVIGSIAAAGTAEIVNDVEADPRRIKDGTGVRSLLCAPLKVGERVIGVIALGSDAPAAYTAAELKLLNTLALQTATAIENARLFERTIEAARERERLLAANQEIELARAGLERELELAARIHADMFPAALPAVAGYELAARNRPARQCGGDYYDALPTAGDEGERLLLCVADVSGKGMPAALLMSHTQATLRALIGRTGSLAALAAQAGDLLYASTAGNKYVTATFLDLHPATGEARFVSAGHVDCLVAAADAEPRRLSSTGAPLGLLPPGQPYTETTITVAPGDVVLLFSDGVVDAQNAADEEFGEDRVIALLRETRHEPATVVVDRLFAAIDQFVGDAPQFDDITAFALKRMS